MYRHVRLQGRTKGWLFEEKLETRTKFEQYQECFRSLIDSAREQDKKLVPGSVETNDYSLWQSPRRGAVLETTNNHVDAKVIELINR